MNKTLVFWPVAILTACTSAPYALRDMGSFHVGGRDVEITGKSVKEVVFTPGGVPAKVDLNGTYSVEAMYVQYFLPANRRGAGRPMWHGRGPDGRHLRDDARRREGLDEFFHQAGLGRVQLGTRLSAAARAGRCIGYFQGERVFLAKANPSSAFASGRARLSINYHSSTANVQVDIIAIQTRR